METETVDPPARWIVHPRTVTVPAKAPATGTMTRQVYYWMLNDVVPVPAFDPPRFYLMNPKAENPDYWSLPENPDYWFILKGYLDTYIKGIPVPRLFPNVGLQLCDAYGLDGKPREKKVESINELKRMVETTPEDLQNAKDRLSDNDVSYHAHKEGLDRYFTFDAFDLPINHLYVKLSDKDLRLMNTSGGIEQPEEVYILESDVDHFATNSDNGHRFGIRTEDGTPKMFDMANSVSVTKEEWAARKNRAINSMDGEGGWTRMINPVLTLYLVPVAHDWVVNLQRIMESIETQAKLTPVKCLQTWKIYETRDELQASLTSTHDTPTFTQVFILILNQDRHVLMV